MTTPTMISAAIPPKPAFPPATPAADMDLKRCEALQEELRELLKPFCDKHSLDPRVFGGRHDELSFECRVELNVIKTDEYGRKLDKYAVAFQSFAPNYGLDPAHLFKEIELDGKKWIIAGIDKASKKTPVMLKDIVDGKVSSYAHGIVVDQIARQTVNEEVARRKGTYLPPSRTVEIEGGDW